MELTAAIEALNALKRRCAVELYTDSEYLQKGIRNWLPRWKKSGFLTIDGEPVKNQDLWQKLEQAASQHEIQWKWVRGHAGNRMNELCDRLAKEALEYGLNFSSAKAASKTLSKMEK
jgi:ribonuclease HI